jgi:alkaline phosphatase
MRKIRLLSAFVAAAIMIALLAGCGTSGTVESAVPSNAVTTTPAPVPTAAPLAAEKTAVPKYVFLFIGDGMTYPQFQITSAYLGALEESDDILSGGESLSFMQFPVAGCDDV